MEEQTEKQTVTLKIYRGEPGGQYWEEFSLPYDASSNLISLLMRLRHTPATKDGKTVCPVAWEAGCLEEVCGSCSILVNGVPRQACSAIVAHIVRETGSSIIRLAPLSKFPLVRDLVVDRSSMFENLKRVSAWVEVDGYYDAGPGPRITQKQQEVMYALSTCMTCGCCSESCPQVNERSPFMGPAPISQVQYFSLHPTAKQLEQSRLRVMQEEAGAVGCANAQNCVAVCPKKIPLTNSIGAVARATSVKTIKDIFGP